ncbi:hypothetical protein C8J56DRAFT_1094854 [Mycena floridula]|nr:hypothetical protein C8J56DRAFT_1094854 [Mycena floridula]
MDLAALEEAVRNLHVTQYVSITGCALLLYDHLLTFDDEVELIWSTRWTLPKVLFLLVRYLVPISMVMFMTATAGLGNEWITPVVHFIRINIKLLILRSCKIWYGFGAMIGIGTIAIGNFMVLLHIWNLWDRDRRFILLTMTTFVGTQIASIICGSIVIRNISRNSTFNHALSVCVLTDRSQVGLLWATGVVFEVVALSSLLWSALSRPRDTKTEFTKILYRDGSLYFLVSPHLNIGERKTERVIIQLLFCLRVINLLLAVVAPLSLLFVGVYFIWCSTTLTVTRLVMRLRRLSVERKAQRPSTNSPDIGYVEQWGSSES